MATLGSLVISLTAETAKFTEALSKAEYTAKQRADNIKNAMAGIGTALAGAISIAKLESMFKGIMDIESAALKMANRLGTSVEVLSSFASMARKTGMDAETFYQTLTRLEKGLSAAAKGAETSTGKFDEDGEEILKTSSAYNELGLKAEILNKLPLDQKLMEIAAAFKANIAPQDQVRVAMELGGKSAAGMVNVLREGPEAIAKLMARQRELGVITTEGAKAASEFKGSVADLTAAWGSFTRNLADSVAPGLTWLINKLTTTYLTARDIASRLRDIGNAPMSPGIAAGTLGGRVFGEGKGEGGLISGGAGGGGSGGGWGAEPGDPFVPTAGIRKDPFRDKPTAGGKGGGGDMGLDRMQSIIDTLQKDLSRLTEGSLAEIDAWAKKTITDIEKVGKKGADTEQALAMVAQVEAGKKKKVTEDYELFVAKESGDAYVAIEGEAKAWLEKHKGFAGAEEQIARIKAGKIWEEDVKNSEKRLGMQKTVLEQLAQESPFLSQQLMFKAKILPLEIEMNRLAMEKMIFESKINQAQADELRGMQALLAQAKKYRLEREKWQKEGVGGGLKSWALKKQQDSETSLARQTEGVMNSLESSISSTISKGIIGALKGEKVDFQEFGWGIAEAFISKTVELGVSALFNLIAQAVLPMVAGGVSTGIEIQMGAMMAGMELEMAGMAVANEMIVGATTAAEILSSSGGGGGGGLGIIGDIAGMFFHSGGVIRAHGGLNLASDEVPIIAQTGERVLSRSQNRDYETGRAGGPGGGGTVVYNPTIHINAIDAQGVEKVLEKHGRAMVRVINRQIGTRGRKL